MNGKWKLIGSIFQLVVGLSAVVAFIILSSNGENTLKWTITLFLAIAYVILGIVGIIDYKSNK